MAENSNVTDIAIISGCRGLANESPEHSIFIEAVLLLAAVLASFVLSTTGIAINRLRRRQRRLVSEEETSP